MKSAFVLALIFIAEFLAAVEVTVGGDKIQIPAPTGFTDITAIAPDTVAMIQDIFPTNSHILAVFATITDAGHILRGEEAVMKRYLIAQSVLSLEHLNMSPSMFVELRKQMRAEYENVCKNSKHHIEAMAASASRNMTKRFGDATSMKIGQMLPLSIDNDTTYSISLSTLTKYAFASASEQYESVSVSTMSITLLKGRVVHLNVFSAYDSDEDLKWTRQTSALWSLASLKANAKTLDEGLGSVVPPGTRVDPLVSALMTETQVVYSTAGHAKARGLNVTVKYPTSWKSEEGIRPHIVHKFTGDSVGGVSPMCMLVVRDLPPVVKFLLDQGGSEKMFSECGVDFIPPGAKHIDSATTKIDGQPAAWAKYYYESERAGIRAGMYCLQYIISYKNNMFVLQCGVSGLASSPEILSDSFDNYLPLFQNMANSIVIEDKWTQTPTSGDVVSSVIKDRYGEYWWITLIISTILTWGIGLLPPLLIRFAFMRHALPKLLAIIVAVVLWILNSVIFIAFGSKGMIHAALLLVAWASYSILRKGSAIYDAQMAKDAEILRQREEAGRVQAERIRQDKMQREAEEARHQAENAKMRAEEERRQAGDAKMRADEARRQAEDAKMRADEARRQAEDAKRRAEEERRENDRRRAQQEDENRRRDDQQRKSRGTSFHRFKDERYYASILGLRGPTTLADVHSRYREMASQYHPDKVNHLGQKLKDVAENEMKDINEAYDYFKNKFGNR